MKEAPWDSHIEACGYEPAPSRVLGSTGAAGRQGRARSCCPAFILCPYTSHMSCSHLILPLLLSPRPAWQEADRHLAAPLPGWGMMLSPSPLAFVWEEEIGWEAGDGGRGQMRERRKMLGQLTHGLQPRRRDGNLHPFRGTGPGGKVLSKHPSPAEGARGGFCSCP